MAHLADRGVHVLVLTVFGGDPHRDREAGVSNRRAGFTTTGEAARVRRSEDDVACERLGVRPVRLPFDDDEASPRDRAAVADALGPALRHADVVLVPGSPLDHPDHLLVAGLAAACCPPSTPVGLYLEQPYASWRAVSRRGGRPWRTAVPDAPAVLPQQGREPGWQRSGASLRCHRRKLAAAGAYRSQLRVLRRWPRLRIAAHEALARGERLAWPHRTEA